MWVNIYFVEYISLGVWYTEPSIRIVLVSGHSRIIYMCNTDNEHESTTLKIDVTNQTDILVN